MSEAMTGVPAANASVSTMPKLSPPSDGAASTSAASSTADLVASSTLPSAVTPRGSISSGESSSAVGPITVSSQGMCSRSASKARSSRGRPLRGTAWPTNAICSVSPRRPGGGGARPGRIDADAVGDHPVVAAEPAAAGPGGGFRDGDPDVQAVEHPPGADQVGDAVGQPLGRVGVERPDQRQPGPIRRDPAGQRRHRLVDVDDVVAAACAARGAARRCRAG